MLYGIEQMQMAISKSWQYPASIEIDDGCRCGVTTPCIRPAADDTIIDTKIVALP
jgi:hypothetical protein